VTAPPFVAFLSDYGRTDEFVGVCTAVVLGIAPEAHVVDITHDLPPHDVRAGALTLLRAAQYLPEGAIVLAVVDPGVGTDRLLVGVETEAATLVGPDNGLLAPAVAMLGGPTRVVSLTRADRQLPAPAATFAGRDVLAPAAGYLAAGEPLTSLGVEVDPSGLMPGLVPLPEADAGGAIRGEVLWIDRFGNCQLNIGPDDLEARGALRGGTVEVHLGGNVRAARWVETYAEARPSELVVLVDSYGLASLALDRASAAAACGLQSGSAVTLVPPGASVEGST